jgi:hypothetical protein
MRHKKRGDGVPNNGSLQHMSLKNNTHSHNVQIEDHQHQCEALTWKKTPWTSMWNISMKKSTNAKNPNKIITPRKIKFNKIFKNK